MTKSKQKLIVFFGKPGVGKSTLINCLFNKKQIIDVLPFVKRYEKDGKVPEVKTIHAYKDMYEYINNSGLKNNIILELGTNHPEINVEELSKLGAKFDLKIFLCDAPKYICRERAAKRERDFDEEALERRLNRDFPNSHLGLLEKEGMKYKILNMEKSLDEIRSEVKENLLN